MEEYENLRKVAAACGFELEPYEKNRKPHILLDDESGEGKVAVLWDPRYSDGDGARMEAKLSIHIQWVDGGALASVSKPFALQSVCYSHEGDVQAARRMAAFNLAMLLCNSVLAKGE